MTINLTVDGTIEMYDNCPIEDAETLLQYLLASPRKQVDWRRCTQAHTAVIQVLMASGAVLLGPPANDFLGTRVEPLVRS